VCLGCFECCIKCLGGIPYPSLIATILLYAGVALFCGCGHEALSGTVTILQNYFEVVRSPVDALDVFTMWVWKVQTASRADLLLKNTPLDNEMFFFWSGYLCMPTWLKVLKTFEEQVKLLAVDVFQWFSIHSAGLILSSTWSMALLQLSSSMASCWWWRDSSPVEPLKTCMETSRSPPVDAVSALG